MFNIKLPSSDGVPASAEVENRQSKGAVPPAAVGWERNSQGKLASRVADLGSTMDPKQYALCFPLMLLAFSPD